MIRFGVNPMCLVDFNDSSQSSLVEDFKSDSNKNLVKSEVNEAKIE
jgi:hypothetical protein